MVLHVPRVKSRSNVKYAERVWYILSRRARIAEALSLSLSADTGSRGVAVISSSCRWKAHAVHL